MNAAYALGKIFDGVTLAWAEAAAPRGTGAGGFSALIPLLIMGSLFGWFLMTIAKRKGQNKWFWFASGFVPAWNFFAGIWLASYPDFAITEQLNTLTNEVQKLSSLLKDKGEGNLAPVQESWTCTCGQVNQMDVPNCPECGLKRDFLLKKKGEDSET